MGSTIRRRLELANPAPVAGLPFVIAFAALFAACAPARPPQAASPGVAPDLAPYLLDPARSCAGATSTAEESAAIHRRLIATGDAERAAAEAEALLARDPAALHARAVIAQARLVAGNLRDVAALTAVPPADLAACAALSLVRGRALELSSDLPGAFGAYRLASASPTAAARAAQISGPAREAALAAFNAGMRKGHLEAAAWYLEQLELWWPQSEAALRARLEMAAATHDVERELAAARALHQAHEDDAALTLRRARLELEAGDARTGLALVERLAAASPGEPALMRELEHARFEWRLQNAPDRVRQLARQSEVTRADLAELVFWLVPRVRTARPAGGRIASDVLDHPAREEIVRMVNLGLMSVDETLHRFAPGAPLRRGEALRTLLRLLRFLGSEGCGAVAPGEAGEGPCGAAAACGLISAETDCSPGASLSGRELVELLRAALAASGES
jgi:hypothetical protein